MSVEVDNISVSSTPSAAKLGRSLPLLKDVEAPIVACICGLVLIDCNLRTEYGYISNMSICSDPMHYVDIGDGSMTIIQLFDRSQSPFPFMDGSPNVQIRSLQLLDYDLFGDPYDGFAHGYVSDASTSNDFGEHSVFSCSSFDSGLSVSSAPAVTSVCYLFAVPTGDPTHFGCHHDEELPVPWDKVPSLLQWYNDAASLSSVLFSVRDERDRNRCSLPLCGFERQRPSPWPPPFASRTGPEYRMEMIADTRTGPEYRMEMIADTRSCLFPLLVGYNCHRFFHPQCGCSVPTNHRGDYTGLLLAPKHLFMSRYNYCVLFDLKNLHPSSTKSFLKFVCAGKEPKPLEILKCADLTARQPIHTKCNDVARLRDLKLVNCNLHDHLDDAFAVYRSVRIVWTCDAWNYSCSAEIVDDFSVGYDCSQQWWIQCNVRDINQCFDGTLILLPSAIPIFLWRNVVPYQCPLVTVQSLRQCWSRYNHVMCCTRLPSSRIQWEGVGFHGPNRLPTAEELFSPDKIFVIGGPCFPALWLIVVFWAKSSLV